LCHTYPICCKMICTFTPSHVLQILHAQLVQKPQGLQ